MSFGGTHNENTWDKFQPERFQKCELKLVKAVLNGAKARDVR